MNKEEILAKSRLENEDEGLKEAENQGRKIGITAFALMEIVIVCFNWFAGQPNYVPFAMFWAFVAAEAYPKYRFTKKRTYLVSTITGGMAAVLFLACHVISVMR